jgi:arginyl-tRNA synthetase
VALRKVVNKVGKDIVRFMMLTRKNDQPLDFDLAKVVEQSRDNMVWYVQYAHARAHSVLRHARAELSDLAIGPAELAAAALEPLADPAEIALIRQLAGWPRLVESAAEAHEPHRLAFYMYDVAAGFHGLWTKGKDDASLRFVVKDEPRTTLARLALVQGVQFVIASGLRVFGVTPVTEMR